MSKIKNFLFIILISLSAYANAKSFEKETLVTVHGFLGASWNMHYISNYLENKNLNLKIKHWEYPSREKKIAEHAQDLAIYLQKLALKNPGEPIHFLTHSMGGLILRAAVNHPSCPPEALIGKTVQLAPPNQGAVWGRLLGEFSVSNYLGGDQSGYELMNAHDFEHLGQLPETMNVMVIAGNFSINPWIEEENDGTVAVSETHLTTPHQHVIIPVGHKSILFSKKTSRLVNAFLHD